ncbi:MAG: ABC transporter permease [Promethearchaeota archaeon]
MTETITTYEPDNSLKKGYLFIFKEIYDELKENRWLTYQLFKRDFLTMYKQSFVGILWAFIIPFASVGTFILLNQAGVLDYGDFEVPYEIYAILGMAFWQLFSTGLIASSNSLVKAGTMIVKINFSKKSLVIASIGQAFVSFLIQFGFVIFLFIWNGITPNILILLLPVLVIPIILLTLGWGFILSLLNGLIRDIGNLLSMLITFLMLLTPILYEKPTSGLLGWFTRYNPLYYLVSVPRELILNGKSSDWIGFLVSALLSLILFVMCLLIFHLTETRVTERI